jgi:ferrochelatase
MTNSTVPEHGILLVNLGSPEEPTLPAIRNYLAEFLMDPFVLHMPSLFRAMLVYGVILPFRPKKTLNSYLSVWRNEGSPLILESFLLKKKLESALKDQHIEIAMRYGSPSLETALNAFRKKNISKI